MPHTFHQLYFHFVWGTHSRQSLIEREWRPQLLNILNEEVKKRGGQPIRHNARPDHVHLLVRLPPKINLSEFIGRVKGATSFRVNRDLKPKFKLTWQEGYGVFSLRKDELEVVCRYIDQQEKHHGNGNLSVLMERMEIDQDDWPSEEEMAKADGTSPMNRAK